MRSGPAVLTHVWRNGRWMRRAAELVRCARSWPAGRGLARPLTGTILRAETVFAGAQGNSTGPPQARDSKKRSRFFDDIKCVRRKPTHYILGTGAARRGRSWRARTKVDGHSRIEIDAGPPVRDGLAHRGRPGASISSPEGTSEARAIRARQATALPSRRAPPGHYVRWQGDSRLKR